MSMERTVTGYASDANRSVRHLEASAKTLAILLDRSKTTTTRLEGLADRAFGTEGQPAKTNSQTPEAVPNGTLASIEILLRKLSEQHDAQEELITRLENMV